MKTELLINMAKTIAFSEDVNTRINGINQIVDALIASDDKVKENQLPIESVFITVGRNLFGLTKQQYVSIFYKLYYAENDLNKSSKIMGCKIRAIKMLRVIGENKNYPIGIKEAKDAVEDSENFPKPINEYYMTAERS